MEVEVFWSLYWVKTSMWMGINSLLWNYHWFSNNFFDTPSVKGIVYRISVFDFSLLPLHWYSSVFIVQKCGRGWYIFWLTKIWGGGGGGGGGNFWRSEIFLIKPIIVKKLCDQSFLYFLTWKYINVSSNSRIDLGYPTVGIKIKAT